MKPVISQQTALKGLLLVVLAANVSWQGAFRQLNEFHSASESAPAAGTPVLVRSAGATIAPAAPSAPAQRPGISTAAETRNILSRNKVICGVQLFIQYSAVPGENRVREIVQEQLPERRTLLATYDTGSFDALVNNADGFAQTERTLETRIREALGSRCTDTASSTIAPASGAASTPASTTAPSDATRIANGVRECRLDSQGRPLERSASLTCNQERLATITSVDPDNRRESSRARSEFQRIVRLMERDLRPQLRRAALDGDLEETREIVEEAVEAIQDAGANLDMSPAALERITSRFSNMHRAFAVGGETAHIADEYREQYSDVSARMNEARAQMDLALQSGDQFSANAALQQYQATAGEGLRLNQAYNMNLNPRLQALQSYQRQNWIESSDYNVFTRSALSLRSDLGRLMNGGQSAGTLPGSLQAPQNLLAIRSRASEGFQQQYGVPPLARADVNFAPSSAIPTPVFNSVDGTPQFGRR